MSKMAETKKDPIFLFLRRLENVARKVDREMRDLEKRMAQVRSEAENYPSTASENMLEELFELKKTLKAYSEDVENHVADAESSLKEETELFQEIIDSVIRREKWAEQFGYKPVLKDEPKLEEVLNAKEEVNSSDCHDEADEKHEKEDSTKTEEEEEETETETENNEEYDSPNIFQAGMSKDFLKKIGYKFKEDLSSNSKENVDRDDTSSPMIQDAANPGCFVQPGPSRFDTFDSSTLSNCQSSAVESSLVEITPGLMVRSKRRSAHNLRPPEISEVYESQVVQDQKTPETPEMLTEIGMKLLGKGHKTPNRQPLTALEPENQSSNVSEVNNSTPSVIYKTKIYSSSVTETPSPSSQASVETPPLKTPVLSEHTQAFLREKETFL